MLVNMINGSSARSMLLMVLSGVTLLCETGGTTLFQLCLVDDFLFQESVLQANSYVEHIEIE
jgi:hypothetical protein